MYLAVLDAARDQEKGQAERKRERWWKMWKDMQRKRDEADAVEPG